MSILRRWERNVESEHEKMPWADDISVTNPLKLLLFPSWSPTLDQRPQTKQTTVSKRQQYSQVHCSPHIPASQGSLYKPITNYIYNSSDPCHMEVNGRQKFSSNFFPTNDFHMVQRTVTKSIFRLSAFNCTIVIFVGMGRLARQYSMGYTCSTFLDHDMNHRNHCHTVLNGRQKILPKCFVNNSARFLSTMHFRMVVLTVHK